MVSLKVVAEVSLRPLPSTSKGRVPGCAARFAENQPLEPRAAKEILEHTGAQDISSTSEAGADFAESDRPLPRTGTRG